MPLTIEVPDDIARAARQVAESKGTNANEVILDTLRSRFLAFPEDLLEEMRIWESASEQDIAKFNRREGI